MNYNYGFYCSGNASRVLKFFETRDIRYFSVSFILYDGCNFTVSQKLDQLFGDKLITFVNEKKLKGRHLSEYVSNLLLENMRKNEIDYLFCFGSKILK